VGPGPNATIFSFHETFSLHKKNLNVYLNDLGDVHNSLYPLAFLLGIAQTNVGHINFLSRVSTNLFLQHFVSLKMAIQIYARFLTL
jgi:hypothetical protein